MNKITFSLQADIKAILNNLSKLFICMWVLEHQLCCGLNLYFSPYEMRAFLRFSGQKESHLL